MHSVPLCKRAKPGLGSLVRISLSDSPRALEWSDAAFAEMARLEKIFNRFDPESELSAVNGGAAVRSPELAELLALAEEMERLSDGAFSPRPEGSIDLGGIAKGYIVDKMFARLPAGSLVNAGGDLRVSGEAQVELRAPGDRRYALVLAESALATSLVAPGSIGVPRARYPRASRFAGASAVAATCAIADAATKVALFGEVACALALPGMRSLCLFDERGEVVHREG